MGGIAICFPMSDLPVRKMRKSITVAQYLGHIAKANMIYGRTAETCEGIARSVEKHRGRTAETHEYIARTAEKNRKRPRRLRVDYGSSPIKGRTKENYPYLAKRSAEMTGKTKYNSIHCDRISMAKTGITKETHEYVARAVETKSGRTKYNHLGVARISEFRKGKTKDNTPFVARQAATLTGRTKETHEYLQRASEFRKTMTGEKAANWIDGRSFLPYTPEFNIRAKERIKERDDYSCQVCGITEERHRILNKKRGLSIHHINYNKAYNDDKNMVTTCLVCNNKANSNREFWQRFFTDKLLIKTNGTLVYG